nr:hypothetical protein [Tanacetum cinerariifolium]
MIVNSIENGPYVRRMIATPGEPDLPRIDADDQAIQTILLGLPKDVYAAVDSYETTKEIWERVRQMMKGSDIGEQEKKAKLFNEWEKFTSTDGESIESYYHCFMQLMNDLKRNKHFSENIAANLKFLNNLQPEWKRHVTIVRQTKNLHETDFTQIYDFLKINQDENVEGNGGNQFGQYAGQVAQNQQGYNAWQNGGIEVTQNEVQNAGVQSGGNQNRLVVVPEIANQNGTGNVVAARGEDTESGNQARCYNCIGLGQEFDFMAAAGDLDEIEEVNANCILMVNLQHASTSGTQLDKAPVYDTDGSAEVQINDNCYDIEIFNMFTQEEQYTDLLEPIPEPQLMPQNDNHVASVAPSMVQSGGTVETSFAPNEETHALQETVYRPYKIGTYRETLAESTEGTPQFASTSTQVPPPLTDLSSPAEELIENLTNTNQATVKDDRVVVQNVQRHSNRGQGMNLRGGNVVGYGGAPNRVGNDNQGQERPGQARTMKCFNCNDTGHIIRNCTQPRRPQNSEYFKDKMLLMQAQENRVALDEEQLLFLAGGQDNANECDAFDSDVDETPTAQTMFMANLSSADPVIDEAGPSYDSNILSEVPDYEHYLDAACTHHEGHVTYDNIQLDHFVNSHADYTSDRHMIPYDQYVRDNEMPVVHSGASSVPTDAFMMIYDDMCEPHDQSVSYPSRNTVVKNSLTAKLAIYKEHVELYKQRAKFELTKREQKINEQLRIVISNRNFKEETLKKELHSIKLQLASTINHNKSIVEEVSFLKKDFKQKENKPRPNSNELKRVAIGYKNPVCLTRAKQVQPALYNGHEIIKDNHTQAIVHNSKDTLEIAEIIRKKMNDKMNDPKCVTRKVKIAPHDHSKENLLATFTPQKQLTPEQIFWSNDLMKLKSKALKEWTKVIPFFKTLKDNFESIQKALTKEVKEMKDVFEELEAEVAQYAVDRKHDAIELKNLLIANDNLIAKCLSQEVFYVATNSELNVARFTKMHVANTIAETRCLALEAELANLRETNNHDNQKELINHFSKLKVSHLNLQLKYQNLKDRIRSNPSTPDKHTPDFDSIFVIGKMQASLQEKDNVIRQLKRQLFELQVTPSDTDRTLRVQTTDSQITELTDHVTHLQAQNDMFRAENDKIKQHYKELYDSIKITRANHIEQVTKLTTENVNLKTCISKATVNPQVSARDKHAIDVEPIVPFLRNNRDAHLDYLRHLKESVETIRDIVEEAKVVRPLDRSIVSDCRYTKHSQELLEYAICTCPQGSQQRAKQIAHIPLIRKKQVTIAKPSDKSDSTTHRHVVTVKSQKTNVPVPPSTGVNSCPNARRSQPKSHVKANKISPAKGDNKLLVDDQPRKNKSHLRTSNRIDSSSRLKRTIKMADVIAPSGQTPTMAPPVCADDQILPHIRPRAPVLQILWGIVTRTNIDYTERIWEEFTQSIHTFIEDKQNLSQQTSGKKRATLIVIPSIRFTKLIIHHLQRKHRFHPRPDSPLHLSNEEPVLGYLKFSAKGGVQNPPAPKPTQPARKPKAPTRPSISIPVASTQPAPTSDPAKSQENKRKQATKTTDKPAKAKRIKRSISRKTRQPRSSPKSVGASEAEEVPAEEPQVVDEDTDYQKAVEEIMRDAYALPKGPLPPVVIREPDPVVHAGSDREHMDLDVADVSPQPSTEQLDEGFTATVYPNV